MTSTHRGASIAAGFVTLFEAVIWVILSIIFVAAYTCHWGTPYDETKKQDSNSILYVTYFKGSCQHTNASPNAEKTYIWMVIYAVMSACWIPSSVLLIVAAITKSRGGYGACMYFPWLFVTSALMVLDLVATVLYGIDISKSLTVEDYKKFMAPLVVNTAGADGITALPAIEMTLYFCRAAILWVVNLLLLIVVIQATRGVAKSQAPRVKYNKNITKSLSAGRQEPVLADPQEVSKRWVSVAREGEDGRGSPGSWEKKHPWLALEARQPPEEGSPPGRTSTGSSQGRLFTVDGTPVQLTPKTPSRPVGIEARDNNPRMMGWSYTQPMSDAIKPKHDSMKGVEKPPVPVPDYTMHVQAPRRYPSILQPGLRQPDTRHRAGSGAY